MPFFSNIGQPIDAVVGDIPTGTPTGAAGKLRIEPDQLDGAIAVFKGALNELESEVRWANQELFATPPANDAVSNDAAEAFNRLGYMNDNSAIMAWEGAVQQLRSIVEQLEKAKQAIMRADAGNTTIFQDS